MLQEDAEMQVGWTKRPVDIRGLSSVLPHRLVLGVPRHKSSLCKFYLNVVRARNVSSAVYRLIHMERGKIKSLCSFITLRAWARQTSVSCRLVESTLIWLPPPGASTVVLRPSGKWQARVKTFHLCGAFLTYTRKHRAPTIQISRSPS